MCIEMCNTRAPVWSRYAESCCWFWLILLWVALGSCASTQLTYACLVIQERFPLLPRCHFLWTTFSVSHFCFILLPTSTLSLTLSLFPFFLPGFVNDLILMKYRLGGETRPHGWSLSLSLLGVLCCRMLSTSCLRIESQAREFHDKCLIVSHT